MIKPAIISPNESVNQVGEIFDTPYVTKGWTWLPLTEFFVMFAGFALAVGTGLLREKE